MMPSSWDVRLMGPVMYHDTRHCPVEWLIGSILAQGRPGIMWVKLVLKRGRLPF